MSSNESSSSIILSSATASASSSASASPSHTLNSNLYLFTFVATLLLLLVVSSGVIIRAIMLRSMHRRRVNRALDQGLVPISENGTDKLSFSAKPKLFDVWLTDQKQQLHWSDITPVSVQPISSMTEKDSSWASTMSLRNKSQSTIRSKNSAASSELATDLLQVSVVIAMPCPPHTADPDEVPEVALGFTHSYAAESSS